MNFSHASTETEAFRIARAVRDVVKEPATIYLHSFSDLSYTVAVDVEALVSRKKYKFIWDIAKQRLEENMATITPTLTYDSARDVWFARVPYNQAWINDFKYQVPGQARSWDGTQKVWIYDPMFHPAVKTLCDIHFKGYKEATPPPPPPPPPSTASASASHEYFKFLRLCSKEALKKLYRDSALTYHPDRGGDPAKMAELNVLWQKISKELGI